MMPYVTETFVAPCWHIKVDHEKKDCNLVLSQDLSKQDVTLGGRVEIPFLQNSCPVTKGTSLVLYMPKPPQVTGQVEELQDVKRRKRSKAAE